MSNSEAIPCPVLQSFFPDSVTLREYILNQIQEHHVQVPEEFLTNVGSSLQSLLDTAMVASIPFTSTDANSTRSKKNRTTSNAPHVVDNIFTNTIYPLSISQEQVNSAENFNWQICLAFFFYATSLYSWYTSWSWNFCHKKSSKYPIVPIFYLKDFVLFVWLSEAIFDHGLKVTVAYMKLLDTTWRTIKSSRHEWANTNRAGAQQHTCYWP